MTDSQRGERSQDLRDGVGRSSGSFELVGGAVLMGVLGWFLDGVIGTRPVLTIALAALGLIGATLSVVYRYRWNMARETDARSRAAGTRAEAHSA